MLCANGCALGVRDGDIGQVFLVEPGDEKSIELFSRGGIESGLQVVPAGYFETLRFPEIAYALVKHFFAQTIAQHDKYHRRLAIADRGIAGVGARAEVTQRSG